MTERATGQTCEVAVVGGGVIGLFCALELAARGRDVVVFEAGVLGHGSSHGNCGTITPSHAPPLAMPGSLGQAARWMWQPDAPLYIAPRLDPGLWHWLYRFARQATERQFRRATRLRLELLNLSLELLAAWIARENMACEFRRLGTLYVFRDRRALDRFEWYPKLAGEIGWPVEFWDAARLAAEEPALLPGQAGAWFNPGDASLRPDRLLTELGRAVRRHGATWVEGAEIAGFERRPGGAYELLASDGRQWRAHHLVLAAGAWSPRLARQFGIALPIQPGKGYSLTYTRPDQVPRRPLVLKEAAVCVSLFDSGFRLGSTMEFSGYDRRLNPRRLAALRRAAQASLRCPAGPELIEEWYGWRPMTPDDLPVISAVPGWPNCYLATGHGMLGVSLAAVTARLIADLMTATAPPLDPAPFAIERFA